MRGALGLGLLPSAVNDRKAKGPWRCNRVHVSPSPPTPDWFHFSSVPEATYPIEARHVTALRVVLRVVARRCGGWGS